MYFSLPKTNWHAPDLAQFCFSALRLEAFSAFLLGVMDSGQLPLEQGHLCFIHTSLRSGTMPTMIPCSLASGPVQCWPLRWPCCHHLVTNHCQSRSVGHAGVCPSWSGSFSIVIG